MDEAYCITSGCTVGVFSAIRLMNAREIPSRRAFQCADDSCRAHTVLKADRSTKRSPYFSAVGHSSDCEYASRSGGARTGATELALRGDLELTPGSFAPIAGNSSSTMSTFGPNASWTMVSSHLTIRALVDVMQAWSPHQFRTLQVTVLRSERRVSHLFLRASWLAHFNISHDSVRWPRWMGPAKFADATKNAHVVFGEAIVESGFEYPPAIAWLTDDSGDRAVRMASDPVLFARSKFCRRFGRDLASVGWTAGKSARCIAVVLCTARSGPTGEVALYPAGSYEDVLLLPSGSTHMVRLYAALAAYESRFKAYLEGTNGAEASASTSMRSDEMQSMSDLHPSIRELFKRPDPVQHLPKEQNTPNQQTVVAQPSPSNADTAETPPRGPIAAIRRLLRAVGRRFNR